MEEKKTKSSKAWIIVGIVVALLFTCGLGAIVGGAAGYALGRRVATRNLSQWSDRTPRQWGPRQSTPLPEQPDQSSPQLTLGGALVVRVVAGSPADEAGLQVGDIIQQVDGQSVQDNSLAELIGQYQPGDRVTLSVLRDASSQQIIVTLGENEDTRGAPWLGIDYQELPTIDSGSGS